MKQLLQDRLRPGEKVLWQGHPAGIRLMDPAFRLKNVIVWAFAALFAAAAVWYAGFYAPAAGIEMAFAAKVSFSASPRRIYRGHAVPLPPQP